MFKSLRGRIVTIVLVMIVAGWQLYSKGLKLGLDLQGGMHLALEIDDPDGTLSAEVKSQMIDQVEIVIRQRIDELGVNEPLIQKAGNERLIVELAGVTDQQRARDIVQQAAFLEFKLVLPNSDFAPALPRIDRAIVATLGPDSLAALGRSFQATDNPSADEINAALFGGGAADTTAAADSTAAVDSTDAAAEDEELNLRPFTSLLLQGEFEGTYYVAVEDEQLARTFLALESVQRAFPRNIALHWGSEPVGLGVGIYKTLYVLEEDAFLRGDRLEDAIAQRDPQFNQAQVAFELSRAGGREFSRFTGQHVGDYLAIVLDGDVMSAPVIQDRIGARGQINLGNSPMEEARDLALVLRAGALPAPLRIEDERSVDASLGADSVARGRVAGIFGLMLVLVVMIGYYRVAGVIAVAALGVYVLLVLGGLAGIGATLTLPGLAGLILSIGMAVDANVLIFERIREELEAGRATRTAVDEGFGNALSAIVDANVTTLITALILFQFGTGPVQGFAVTLSIGIAASFFSALYVTRTFFLMYLSGKKASDPISI